MLSSPTSICVLVYCPPLFGQSLTQVEGGTFERGLERQNRNTSRNGRGTGNGTFGAGCGHKNVERTTGAVLFFYHLGGLIWDVRGVRLDGLGHGFERCAGFGAAGVGFLKAIPSSQRS